MLAKLLLTVMVIKGISVLWGNIGAKILEGENALVGLESAQDGMFDVSPTIFREENV